MDERTFSIPSLRKIESTHIRTYRIDTIVLSTVVETFAGLDIRRCIGMRIFHIRINRTVVSLHFPVRRHRNAVPTGDIEILFVEIQRSLGRLRHPVKSPLPVQQHIGRIMHLFPRTVIKCLVTQHCLFRRIRHIRGMTHFLIFFETGFIFPIYLFTHGHTNSFRHGHIA